MSSGNGWTSMPKSHWKVNYCYCCILNVDRKLVHKIKSTSILCFRREGLGSFFGTIGGPVKDTDPTKPKYRERTVPPHEKSNFKIIPPKQGTGYGYVVLNFHVMMLNIDFLS